VGVLDLDSQELHDFGEADVEALQPFLDSLQQFWTDLR